MLILFDGIDGCGKDTQIDLLRAKLKFDYFKYPTRRFGILNDYLEKRVELSPKSLFHLFLADIANEQGQVEKSKLAVLNRYVFATIAYELYGIGYENAKRIVEESGFLKPDIVIYLDITPEMAQARKRAQKQLDRYEADSGYLGAVRANYLRLYEDKFLTKNWHLVDASKGIENVHEDVVRILRSSGVKI